MCGVKSDGECVPLNTPPNHGWSGIGDRRIAVRIHYSSEGCDMFNELSEEIRGDPRITDGDKHRLIGMLDAAYMGWFLNCHVFTVM